MFLKHSWSIVRPLEEKNEHNSGYKNIRECLKRNRTKKRNKLGSKKSNVARLFRRLADFPSYVFNGVSSILHIENIEVTSSHFYILLSKYSNVLLYFCSHVFQRLMKLIVKLKVIYGKYHIPDETLVCTSQDASNKASNKQMGLGSIFLSLWCISSYWCFAKTNLCDMTFHLLENNWNAKSFEDSVKYRKMHATLVARQR